MSDGETSKDLAPGPGQVTTPTNYPNLQTVLLVRPRLDWARDSPLQQPRRARSSGFLSF